MPANGKVPTIPVREVDGRSGRLILVEEEGERLALGRYNNEVASARRGLVVSIHHPSKVKGKVEGGKVLWLSRAKGGLNPTRLDYDVYQAVSTFYKDGGEVVLLTGLEYLSLVNGFKSTARFVKKVGDRASTSGAALIAGTNPFAFEPRELAVLERSFDYVDRGGAGARVVERVPRGGTCTGHSYLFLDKEGFRMHRCDREGGICVTTLQPGKLRRWEGFGGVVVWVSESEEEGALHPSKLRFEIQQRVLRAAGEGCGMVFIEGLEHLVMYTCIADVVGFVKSVSDGCASSHATLVASIDPRGLGRKEMALFRRMFDKVSG